MGFAAVGGSYVISATSVFADTISFPPTIPIIIDGVTYTGYLYYTPDNGSGWVGTLVTDNSIYQNNCSGGSSGTIDPSYYSAYYAGSSLAVCFSGSTDNRRYTGSSLSSMSSILGSGGGYYITHCPDEYPCQFSADRQVIYNGTVVYSPPITDTYSETQFISIYPDNGTTTATTSSVGAKIYANGDDFTNYGRLHVTFTQDSAFACQNSGAIYDAVVTCAGENAPASPIEVNFEDVLDRLLVGIYDLSTTTTFGGGGKWTGIYEIQQVSSPWYFFGLFHTYNTILSTTTHITIGQLSPMDIARHDVYVASQDQASTTRHGIGAILASTTASWKDACNPFSGLSWDILSGNVIHSTFSLSDCVTLSIYPGDSAISDDFIILKETPPWGYVFRVIDILNATTSSSTLPMINYSFASTSPMATLGDIHFDPFGQIAASGSLINEMKSDRSDGATVWTIMMPVVKIFVYFVLFMMIFHDLTGIHSADGDSVSTKRNEQKVIT